ncbi:MAG TPA: ABC transporter substrate-binding protein [Acetobacteraceae bacterium]|jgi:branched-chain amino acid transport system substrate-binding protein|nr:ABC transporter substrate-binding protein [Acetobacteraceae bacterium]
MTRLFVACLGLLATLAGAPAGGVFGAWAQSTVKIGVILPFSGQFADTGIQLDNGIKLYMQQHGDTVAGKKIEVIRKDVGGIAPEVAKRLAQELVVRDNVDILAGFALTPNALAAADVSAQAKKFMVVMNAATSIVTTKSPYMARTSVTIPQIDEEFGDWAAKQGVKTVYTMVSDYGPGIDAETSFIRGFEAAGGKAVGSVRVPVANPDFSAFVQRAKDTNPDAIFIFVPGGAQPAALGKALASRGITPKTTKILGNGEVAMEDALKNMGDDAVGIITAFHYDPSHDSALNREFVTAYVKAFGRNPDIFSIGGYDGMRLIYDALAKTGGKTGGQALIDAAKGMAWESPRGPIAIDKDTRDIVQTVYIRRVEKVDGRLVNVEFDKIADVKDPVKARMPK